MRTRTPSLTAYSRKTPSSRWMWRFYACPIGLNPYLMKHLCDKGDLKGAEANNVMECIVCGSCSYVCPAKRWLTASFKNTKDAIMREARRAKK